MAIDLLTSKEQCCGCRTCEQVCAFGAITMVEDEMGFLYPSIDADACTECGLCLKKCAFQSGYKHRKEFEPYYGYGARHLDQDVFMHSRSGGAFVAMSDVVLEAGGEVYGAGYEPGDPYFRVIHKCATTKEQRDEFCGSKYVQSDVGDVFAQVKASLREGREVLFSGTGCQVGALHVYLGKEYPNLYTMDIVCHGTPSPKVWHDFLVHREMKFGEITAVNFRDKREFGWTAHRETITAGGADHSSRIFSKLFAMGMSRPCCFSCVYCNTDRPGDVTIADFWGHDKALGDKWDDDLGISLVLVNTAHGMELWDKASKSMEVVDCTGFPFRHTNLKRPTTRPARYDEFWTDYIGQGYGYCVKKYVAPKKKPASAPSEPPAGQAAPSKQPVKQPAKPAAPEKPAAPVGFMKRGFQKIKRRLG